MPSCIRAPPDAVTVTTGALRAARRRTRARPSRRRPPPSSRRGTRSRRRRARSDAVDVGASPDARVVESRSDDARRVELCCVALEPKWIGRRAARRPARRTSAAMPLMIAYSRSAASLCASGSNVLMYVASRSAASTAVSGPSSTASSHTSDTRRHELRLVADELSDLGILAERLAPAFSLGDELRDDVVVPASRPCARRGTRSRGRASFRA